MQFYLAFEIKLYAGDGYNCTGKVLRFFKIHLKQFAFITYQEMAPCTDRNLPINVQTIGPLFQVTHAQTEPKFV